MEIGHNVLHGQYDWMTDRTIGSRSWEWDAVSTADSWRYAHNFRHHTFTNVIGKDRDLGYSAMRVDADQPWHPIYLIQPIYGIGLALTFEWGIALYDMELDAVRRGEKSWEKSRRELEAFARKAARQVVKDFVLWPALSGGAAKQTALGVVDHGSGAIVWCAPGRNAATLQQFFELLGDRRHSIRAVSIDMSGGYQQAINASIPGAEICFDPFHVVRLAQRAVDQVRRDEWNAHDRSHTAAGKWIKGTRWSLLKSPAKQTLDQLAKLGEVQQANRPLYRAFLLTEELRLLYALDDPALAPAEPDRKRRTQSVRFTRSSSWAISLTAPRPSVRPRRSTRPAASGTCAN